MVVSIHQPGYFPWLGLLDKIRRSDTFVVMDEVQLTDKAYQHRNLFLTADGRAKFLTIPFVKRDYLKLAFRDLDIASPDWKTNHLNFLRNSYRSHPFAREIMPRLEAYYAADYPKLVEAVMASMRLSFELFGIDTRVVLQSSMEYDRSLHRGDLVVALVRASGAQVYLSGTGAKAYLDESAFRGDLQLRYATFEHPRYVQAGVPEFVPGLSCLDLMFNVGIAAGRAILKRNDGRVNA